MAGNSQFARCDAKISAGLPSSRNFVKRSVVYIDDKPVPTEVVSRTEIEANIPATLLAEAGRRDIVVRNPKPLSSAVWGDTSNMAHLLVPFEFTKTLPQPRW